MKITRWGLGLLSLVALLTSVGDASAWGVFGWRPHCFETHITCRPYNAFTPICWGNLICDGCCPNPCAAASGCNMFPSGGCMGDGCMAGGFMPGGYYAGFGGGYMPAYAGMPFNANPAAMPN